MFSLSQRVDVPLYTCSACDGIVIALATSEEVERMKTELECGFDNL